MPRSCSPTSSIGCAAMLGAGRLERGLVDLVLEHPVAGELARLDVGQDALHLGLRLGRDDARAGDVLAVLGGVGDRVVHVGDAALVDEVDDQLHLVQALEIGHLGRVARLDQGLEAGLDELDEAAAEHHLLAEQVGLALLLEGGLDDAGAAAADGGGVGEAEVVRVAGGVLRDGDEAGHAAAALVLGAHRVARALRRDHQHVEVLARLDQVEVDVEAVREHQRRALLHVRRELVAVDVGLQLVRRQHHDDVGPFRGLGDRQHLDAGSFSALAAEAEPVRRATATSFDAGIAQVEGVGVALAAIADDGDLLALDQVDVGVAIVIDAHGACSPSVLRGCAQAALAMSLAARGRAARRLPAFRRRL